LAGLTLLVLVLSLPGSLRDAFNRGGIYLFSQAFLEDIPRRFTGPGRFRFVLQPLIATILGVLNGLADRRAGRPPYLYGMIFHRNLRNDLVRTGFSAIANLLLMGIFLDAVFQWIMFRVVHPVPALIIGPILIILPYGIARALSNRLARQAKKWATEDAETPWYLGFSWDGGYTTPSVVFV
jgi:hypothetical protein